MKFEYSAHWIEKRKQRNDITDDLIEYAISNSQQIKDKYWDDALNAVCLLPNGRVLKVIYKIKGKDKIRIITAFWLD